jgi:serine/threonine protein kinase/tetratricopeptide (TPR) repeat protein
MSDHRRLDPDDSVDGVPAGHPPGADFLEIRSRKRELLDEMSAGWETNHPVRAEELLPRWPTKPGDDGDVASLLFEEYQQRRNKGEEDSLSDLSRRFPEQRDSLASMIRLHDVMHSIGGSSKSVPRLALPIVGDEVFGFRMRHELGRGAFACVFMGEQADLAGRPVVLKVSALEGTEPSTLAQMQHTNIVPIYSVHDDVAAGMRVVCMPYFGGASLSAVLHAVWAETPRPTRGEQIVRALAVIQAPKWEPKYAAEAPAPATPAPLAWLQGNDFFRSSAKLVAQLAEGLDHAHQRGIFHRDIKPSNILLAADGTPMLLDFNLAEDINTPKARASATLGGTVSYMSPEHLRALAARDPILARKVDSRSDIYSMGMVLYEMLVGQSPFKQSASYTPLPMLIESMAVERSGPAPSLMRKRPDAPWDLESIVRKCLDPNPERRYQRATHLAEDLDAFLNDQPLKHAPQLSKTERVRKWLRRHPRLTSSGSVATVAAALLISVGAALLGVRGHLQSAEAQVEADVAHDKMRLHDAGTLRALCLVNVADVHDENLRQGAEVCEKTLNLFGVLDRADWARASDAAWKHLDREERDRLAENTRELLLLLAWARVHGAPNDRAVLQDALELVDRAAAIPGLAPTPALLEERAHYLEMLGDRTAAAAAHDEAKELKPTTARDYYLLATTHVRAGRLDKALSALNEATRLNPKHYWSFVQRGLVHVDRKELVGALSDFGICIGLDPTFAWGYFNLAYALEQSGEKAEALSNYTAAIGCDPSFSMAYQNRAALRLELGQHAAALADFDKALDLGRSDAVLHAGRALALESLKRPSEAEAAIKAALAKADAEKAKAGEEAAAVRIRWTYAFSISGRNPALARELFNEVLTRTPRHARALYGLALLCVNAGKEDESLVFFDRALEADPNFVHARRFRAVLLARNGRFTDAHNDINLCLAAEPTSGPTLYAAACVACRIAEATADDNPAVSKDAVAKTRLFLERAFQQGYGPGRVDNDPDLAFVRTIREFREFLNK